jgi:thymidylate synthase (FAD)
MKVKVVSYTKPSEELENESISDIMQLIAYVARVSNPSNQMNVKTSQKLIAYLIKNKHWSPLEMADITLEIETTRDIARQILRHRSFCFQEFSQRYSDVSELGSDLFVLSEARLQDTENRQGSLETDDQELISQWNSYQQNVIDVCQEAYEWALQSGIAKEVARKVLPEGMTKSRMYMKGSIRSWIHYLEVRGPDSGTQKEHMQVAMCIAECISKIFPIENFKK